jgi:hypothetical protein
MCKKWLFLPAFLLFSLIHPIKAPAQALSVDSLKNSQDLSYPITLYFSSIGENAHIYNGYEYMTPDSRIKGSPYFLTDGMVPANIYYDDAYYKDIPVLYDVVRDLVVLNRLDQNFRISLISEKLTSFSLQNHSFIRITKDSTHGVDLVTGLYDKLYGGKSTVLMKRRKIVVDFQEYSTLGVKYVEQNQYYVKFEGRYVETNSKSAVLKLFRTKKSEIKSFLRKNKLKFKTDFGKTLVAASAYYDQLTS